MYVCVCKGITESRLRELAAGRVEDPGDLVAVLGLDDPECCGRCVATIEAHYAAPSAVAEPGRCRRMRAVLAEVVVVDETAQLTA